MATPFQKKAENGYCALFIDFENFFYFLTKHLAEIENAEPAATETLRELRNHLIKTFQVDPIIRSAYADFQQISRHGYNEIQGNLYLNGISTNNVLGTEFKNAADMKLCVDAMETLYTRQEVRTYILVAGDRDYIPLINHLREHACTVVVAAFRPSLSGDLLEIIGKESFIDLKPLLPFKYELMDRPRESYDDKPKETAAKASASSSKPTLAVAPDVPISRTVAPTKFNPASTTTDMYVIGAIEEMLEHYSDKPEVWLSPFLHKLRDKYPELSEQERKQLIGTMNTIGAVAIEQREGTPNSYSVLIINWNHPTVMDLIPE